MNPIDTSPPTAVAPVASGGGLVKRAGLLVALVALVALMLMPAPPGLPAAGQVMLAVLVFAVIVWMTEALDYAVSAVVIGALMIFLLAYVPEAAKPLGADMGTGAALGLALSGFCNSAMALVATAKIWSLSALLKSSSPPASASLTCLSPVRRFQRC